MASGVRKGWVAVFMAVVRELTRRVTKGTGGMETVRLNAQWAVIYVCTRLPRIENPCIRET